MKPPRPKKECPKPKERKGKNTKRNEKRTRNAQIGIVKVDARASGSGIRLKCSSFVPVPVPLPVPGLPRCLCRTVVCRAVPVPCPWPCACSPAVKIGRRSPRLTQDGKRMMIREKMSGKVWTRDKCRKAKMSGRLMMLDVVRGGREAECVYSSSPRRTPFGVRAIGSATIVLGGSRK